MESAPERIAELKEEAYLRGTISGVVYFTDLVTQGQAIVPDVFELRDRFAEENLSDLGVSAKSKEEILEQIPKGLTESLKELFRPLQHVRTRISVRLSERRD